MQQVIWALAVLALTATATHAQSTRAVAEVVKEDARAISMGDGKALLALFDEDSRIYATPEHPDRLDGPLAKTMGTHAERMESFPKIAEAGPIRLEVAEIITVGDIAVSKNIFTAPNGREIFNFVIYRIRDGIITDLWHPSRTPTLDPDKSANTLATVNRLVGAVNRNDIAGVRALVDTNVRLFETSEARHEIGDKPLQADPSTLDARLAGLFGSRGAHVSLVQVIAFNEYLAGRYRTSLVDGRRAEGIVVFRVKEQRLERAWRIQEIPL